MSQFRPLNHFVFISMCHVRECSHFTAYTQLTVNPAGAQALTQEPTPPGGPVGPAAPPQTCRCSLRRDRSSGSLLPLQAGEREACSASQASWAPGGVPIWPSVAGDPGPQSTQGCFWAGWEAEAPLSTRLLSACPSAGKLQSPLLTSMVQLHGAKGCAAGTC